MTYSYSVQINLHSLSNRVEYLIPPSIMSKLEHNLWEKSNGSDKVSISPNPLLENTYSNSSEFFQMLHSDLNYEKLLTSVFLVPDKLCR